MSASLRAESELRTEWFDINEHHKYHLTVNLEEAWFLIYKNINAEDKKKEGFFLYTTSYVKQKTEKVRDTYYLLAIS